jgi:hypothetical protein
MLHAYNHGNEFQQSGIDLDEIDQIILDFLPEIFYLHEQIAAF